MYEDVDGKIKGAGGNRVPVPTRLQPTYLLVGLP